MTNKQKQEKWDKFHQAYGQVLFDIAGHLVGVNEEEPDELLANMTKYLSEMYDVFKDTWFWVEAEDNHD